MIALDSAFAGLPDDSWLQARLPNAHVAMRSNNRDVQARLCLQGAGISVLPCSLGDGLAVIEAFVDLDDDQAVLMRGYSDARLQNWNRIEVGALRATAELRAGLDH